MITKVTYNWFYCTGDECYSHEVGEKNVVSILEHLPRGAGDVHYCTITFLNGSQERVLNINTVKTDDLGF